jgi:integrase
MPAAARKIQLTDRSLQALRPAPGGGRAIVWDAIMPGMAVRVSAKGKRVFYAVRRRAGAAQPSWISLGAYPVTSLKEARAKAREALGALAEGQDPATLAEAKRRVREEAERRRRAGTFGAVAEDFIREHLPKRRTARSYEALIRRELIPVLGEKPIGEIRRRDIIALLKQITARGQPTPGRRRPKSGGKHAARHAFAALSKFFNWAVAQDVEGLDANPVAGLKPADLLGQVQARDRVLSQAEIAAVWRAAETMGRPFGALIQVLLLSGQRLNEIARCSWAEIDGLDGENPVLTVPAGRMKGMDGKAVAHTVPLTPAVAAILRSMPRFAGGDFVFTTTAGRRPIGGFSKAAGQARELAGIAHWQVHDLRRTARTGLSETGTDTFIGELTIGHRQSGVHGTYDRHRYDGEKRDALERWERRLMSIVAPEPEPGGNVVAMPAAARAARTGREGAREAPRNG